jgi:feruloyl esterase
VKPALWIAGLGLSCAAAVGIVYVQRHNDEASLAGKCRQLGASQLGAASAEGKWLRADAKAGTPANCTVTATLSPVPGSKIGVVFRLPKEWNGKLLGLGGGGWAGNVTPQAAAAGLAAGYATLQTDGGHPGTVVWDNAWASDPVALDDFAWRAIHEMTVAGKMLAAAYYGKPAGRSYFNGCSTGGRQALMEAQRFPGDYNGIVAGAPVYSLQVQTSQLMRSNLFTSPGAGLDKAQLALVNKSALAACDKDDGIADGVIADPRACHWDPGELACKPGQPAGECLAPAQVAALGAAYSGVLAPDGSWAQWPLSRGGETVWAPFIAVGGTKTPGTDGGLATLSPVVFPGSKVDFDRFSPKNVLAARSGKFAETYEATNPDLAKYLAAGGKLIVWQGESDPGPSPVGAIDYVAAATQRGAAAAGVRLFLLPGVGHCGGGPGADKVDWLAALDGWVEGGKAPATLIATKQDSALKRPLCAWPKVAHYKGKGDSNDPGSYTCVERSKG